MKKRSVLIILSVFAIAMLLTAAAPAKTNLARLEINNKTGGEVQVVLSGGGYQYYFVLDPYTTKTFTVEREIYNRRIYACNQTFYGKIDLTTNNSLIIRKCEKSNLSRLTIINKTGENVELSLIRTNKFYHLRVVPYTTETFTVIPELFYHDTFACGEKTSGYLEMETDVRLVFTACGEPAPNKGEPTQEKIHIDDSPGETLYWRYFNWE